jgi:hypothetical protein
MTDTRAPKGRTGTLLLDPDTINIIHSTDGSQDNQVDTSTAFTFAPNAAQDATLTDFTVNGPAGLDNNNVIVTAANGITISNSNGTVSFVASGGANANTLLLTSSAGSITWNAGWNYGNNGALTLNAGGAISGTGTLTQSVLALGIGGWFDRFCTDGNRQARGVCSGWCGHG